ncbi:AAA family ATPase [Ferrimonas futtsuensis]|uniref:AAA family ATPase n=1 Tax=Ferrimonas futtsuensis TaxID=364764 RepID=UPI000418B61E|nr:AAA family ATPase [Ferrimonas futtsuensis]
MRVELEHLKGISSLKFDIPNQGLWLLTGLNGSGKTSLLAALFRIKKSRAFQDYYKTTATQSRLDTFRQSKVRYIIDGEEVTYTYGGKRWPPKPKRNSSLLRRFPFSSTQFIEANGSRVEPYGDEIIPRRINAANDVIRDFMSSVLGDLKWNELKYVNTRRGVGNQAYLLPYRAGRELHYYSEKNFSLGELCILKLAEKLSMSQDNSLVLIDEIEMALHPQAQVRLLHKLERVANDKSLTVIFSTHSSTLIKNVDRNKIILLSDNGTHVDVKRQVYPAHVLGEIAFDEELNTDFVFFVEDEQAKVLLEQMCGKFYEVSDVFKPMFKVVPVGGYYQVLKMLDRSSQILPGHVRRYAFLDDDVRTEAIPNARRQGTRTVTDLYDRLDAKVNFLPCTPEVGLVDFIESQANLNMSFCGVEVRIGNYVLSREYQAINGDNARQVAKNKLNAIVDYIQDRSGDERVSIHRNLYRGYIDNHYRNIGSLMGLLGPVFNSRNNRNH